MGKPLFADPQGAHKPPDFKSVKEYALAKGVVSAALKQAKKTSDPKEKEALESYAKMLSGRIEGVETEVLPWLKKTLSDFEKFIGLDYFFDLIASEKSEEKKGMLKAILVEKEGLRFSEIEKEYEYLKSLFSNHPLFIEMKQQTGLLRKAAEFGEEGDRASFEKILKDTAIPQLKLLLETTWEEAAAIRAKREEIKAVLGSEEIDLNRYVWGAHPSLGGSKALYYEKVNRVLPGIKPALTYLLYQQIRDRLPEGGRNYIENEFEKLEISQNDWPIERNFFQEELFFHKIVKLYIETMEREASILSAAEENRARILINKKFDAGLYMSGTPTTLMPLSRPTLALTAEALFIASLPYLAFYATQIEVVSIASLNSKAIAGIAALTALFTAAHYGDHYLKYDRFPDENVFIHFGRNLLLMLPLGAAFKALYLSYPLFTSVLGGTVMGLETKSHYESQEYLQASLSAVLTLAMAAQGARRFGVEAKPQGQTNGAGADPLTNPLFDIPSKNFRGPQPKNRWEVDLYKGAKSWGGPSFWSSPRPIPSASGQPSGATALLTEPQLRIQPKTYKLGDILTFVEPMLPKTKAALYIKNGAGLEIDLKVFPIAPRELQEILPILSPTVDDEKVTDGVGDKVFTKKDGKKVVVIVIKNPEQEILSILIKVVDSDFSVGSYRETHPYDDIYSTSHSNSKDATRFSNDRLTVYAKESAPGPSENPLPPNERGRERGEKDESDDSETPNPSALRIEEELERLYENFLTNLGLNPPDTSMSKIGGPLLRQLTLKLSDPDLRIRVEAINELEKMTDLKKKDRIEKIAPLLEDPSEIVRIIAAKALAYLGDGRGIPLLKKYLKDKRDNLRNPAAFYLAELGHEEAIPVLISDLSLKDNFLRTMASQGLKAFGEISEKHRTQLLKEAKTLAKNKDEKERVKAAQMLRCAPDMRAIQELISLLQDRSPEVRGEAAVALAYQGAFFNANSDDARSKLLTDIIDELGTAYLEEKNPAVMALILASLTVLGPATAINIYIPDCLLQENSKVVLEAAALAIDDVSDLFKERRVNAETIMNVARGLLLASKEIKKETLYQALAAMLTDPKAKAIIQKELTTMVNFGEIAFPTAVEIQDLLDNKKRE